jgi:glycosyltransferase involved in cell wall biosynthesis
MKLSGGKKQSSNCKRAIYSYLFLITYYIFGTCCLQAGRQPRISIITSIFKGDLFINEFLKDITRQTVFEECELILLNANPPGTGHEFEAISKYLDRYPNQIIYQQLEHDPGIYGVWNVGIKMARGKYLTNANLDDRLAPDCYAVHARALDQNPDIDLVYSNSYVTKIPNETFERNHCIGLINSPEFTPVMMKTNNLPSFNPMWRRVIHNRFGYFDEQFKIAGDWEFWVRIVMFGAKFKKVAGYHGLFYCNSQGLSMNPNTEGFHKKEVAKIRHKYAKFFKS